MATVNARVRALTKPGRIDNFSKHALQAIETVMESHAQRAIDILQVYPPEKPGSKYRRTFRLRDAWTKTPVRQTRDGLVITVSNDVVDKYSGRSYAEYVHGDEQGANQQEQHASTGWPLVADVLREGYRERLRGLLRNL